MSTDLRGGESAAVAGERKKTVFGWIWILWLGLFAPKKTPNVRSARASGPIPIEFPLRRPSGVTTTIRIFAIIYVAQAAAGIALGIVYAVWTMYPT
jgi:hypothetical protein